MPASKSTPTPRAKPAAKDAIALLQADHEAVSQLFAEYEKTRSASNKKSLVALGARLAARKDELLAHAA